MPVEELTIEQILALIEGGTVELNWGGWAVYALELRVAPDDREAAAHLLQSATNALQGV